MQNQCLISSRNLSIAELLIKLSMLLHVRAPAGHTAEVTGGAVPRGGNRAHGLPCLSRALHACKTPGLVPVHFMPFLARSAAVACRVPVERRSRDQLLVRVQATSVGDTRNLSGRMRRRGRGRRGCCQRIRSLAPPRAVLPRRAIVRGPHLCQRRSRNVDAILPPHTGCHVAVLVVPAPARASAVLAGISSECSPGNDGSSAMQAFTVGHTRNGAGSATLQGSGGYVFLTRVASL